MVLVEFSFSKVVARSVDSMNTHQAFFNFCTTIQNPWRSPPRLRVRFTAHFVTVFVITRRTLTIISYTYAVILESYEHIDFVESSCSRMRSQSSLIELSDSIDDMLIFCPFLEDQQSWRSQVECIRNRIILRRNNMCVAYGCLRWSKYQNFIQE